MDIGPNTAPLLARSTSSTATGSVDPASLLLRNLLRAGVVEAEVVQRLPTELLLNTRLGPLRVDRTVDFEVGARIRLRVEPNGEAPVLKVERQVPQPLRLALAQQPELARALQQSPVLLAEVVTSSRGESQLRVADRILQVAREMPVSRDRLLLIRAERGDAMLEISPVTRRDILLSLLRFLLPQQANDGARDLVRLFEWAMRTAQAAQISPRQASPTSLPESRIAARPSPTAAGSTTEPSSATSSRVSTRTDPAKAVADQLAAPVARLMPATARRAAESSASRVSNPDLLRPVPVAAYRGTDRPAADAQLIPARVQHFALLRAPPPPTSLRILPGSRILVSSPPRDSGNTPGASPASSPGPSPAARVAGMEFKSPVPDRLASNANPARVSAAPTAAARVPLAPTSAASVTPVMAAPAAVPATVNGAQATRWNSTASVAWPDAGPDFTANRSLAPITGLLRELGQFEAAEVVHWLRLLGILRMPSQPATGGIQNDLGALIHRALQPLVDSARTTAALPGSGREQVNGDDGARADTRLPAWLREGLRLVEQALGQNLLQRVTTGLQTEAQQPLSLSLTLPFIDDRQVRPLAIEIEQQGRNEAAAEARWEIRLDLELAGLGPLSCHVSLQGARVGASFFSRSDSIQARIEAALPELRRQLDRVGFIADELHSHVGEPPSRSRHRVSVPVESVIDLKV